MKPSQAACFLLSMVLGEVRVTVADYGIQPVDAVLFIDGAPTYLRLTNSTSLETVYSCVLDNSQNVNSVILSTQIKAVQMDVGQVEENVNDVIRLLSAEAASNGRTLWKSAEELKLFKMRLARYLTTNYYDSRPVLEPDMYLNFKSQRSADWQHSNRGHQSPTNFHHMHPVWGEQTYATHEPRRQFPVPAAIYGSASYLHAPESVGHGLTANTPAFAPTATPLPERAPAQNTAGVTLNHRNLSTTESPASPGGAEQYANSPGTTGWSGLGSSTAKQSNSAVPSLNQHNPGIHPLKSIYGVEWNSSPYSIYEYAKREPEITTGVLKEEDEEEEGTTVSVEGLFNLEKSKMTGIDKDIAQTDTNDKSIDEELQFRGVSRRRFKTGRIDIDRNVTDISDKTVTEDEHSPHVRPSEESSTESDKPKKKSKGKRRNGKKRVAKTSQQSSMATTDPKENKED